MIILKFLIYIIIINIRITKSQNIRYKCGADSFIKKGIKEIELKPIEHNNSLYKRRLKEIDEDGFKKFNIYVDMTNIKKDIELYKLEEYSDLFINSINKAVETLENLLKVYSHDIDTNLDDDTLFDYLELNYWDKEKFGTEAYEKGITFFSMDIDLVIFGKFEEMDESALAAASPFFVNAYTGQPIVGMVYINKNVSYLSNINFQEYLQSIFLHEFTHVLGFTYYIFQEYFDILLYDYYSNIYYIDSDKVIEVAKKYYNCSDIYGVALENYGGEGTFGSHWEARILLGDYMNGYIFPEEQVISEFTLALLEDLGYYKANYYTGGLMRYGKNKGCKFIEEVCVNSSSQIDQSFENEFFDSIHSDYGIDNSCSSGRQSRTYNLFWKRETYYNPNYFNDFEITGYPPADFCPIAESSPNETEYNIYIGHCMKGSGEYGTFIKEKDSTYKTNEEMKLITGEIYSDHSFCYLSSLINKVNNNESYYSDNVRAVCLETFCSSKSLTIKINNDYIVCPREGGKIEVEEYDGYLLCPDYNLICSGTILCNNMFDCVDKKSEIKNESYIYDYKIKTSQNIDRAEDESANNLTNYELSEDGKCPKYCTYCTENKICKICKNDYYKIKIGEYILCLSENELNEGY